MLQWFKSTILTFKLVDNTSTSYSRWYSPPVANKRKANFYTISIHRTLGKECVEHAERLDMSTSHFVKASTQAILDMINTPPDQREVPLIVRLSDAARSHQPLRQIEEEEAKQIRKKS